MFGIGMPEMILILAVALIVIGPKKLPDLAKSLGKALGEFKKATSDLKESMQIDTELKEVKSTFQEIEKDIRKKSKPQADPTNQTPADAAMAYETPASDPAKDGDPDPMEPLKATAEHPNTDPANASMGPPVDGDAPAPEPDADSKIHKG